MAPPPSCLLLRVRFSILVTGRVYPAIPWLGEECCGGEEGDGGGSGVWMMQRGGWVFFRDEKRNSGSIMEMVVSWDEL